MGRKKNDELNVLQTARTTQVRYCTGEPNKMFFSSDRTNTVNLFDILKGIESPPIDKQTVCM